MKSGTGSWRFFINQLNRRCLSDENSGLFSADFLNQSHNMFIYLLAIFIISLVLRLLVSNRAEPSFDVYGHLCFASAVREQKCGAFGKITIRVLGAAGFSHPLMWHWLISFFDPKAVLKNQAWLNGVIDSIFVVVIYLFVKWGGYSERVAIYVIGIYLLTPMWFSSIAIGPRIAGFTPRLISEVAVNLFFMVCLFPIGLSVPQTLILGSLLAAFVLTSSKFGVQAMLLLTPLVSLVARDILPLTSLLVGFILAIVISRGRVAHQIRSQLAHLTWYCKENIMGKMPVSNRNNIRILFKKSDPSIKVYLVKLSHRLLSENSYSAVFFKLPAVVVAAFGCVELVVNGTNLYALGLIAPIIAAILVYIFVNFRLFLFLGEAERYLNHVAFFIALFVTEYALNNNLEWLLWTLLAYGAIYWGLETFGLERFKPNHLRQRAIEDAHVIADLQSLIKPTIVLAYPYQAAGGVFRIILETMHTVIFCFLTSKIFSENFNSKYADDYPYVKLERLDEMADEYQIGYVVLDRHALISRGLEDWSPSSQWIKKPIGGNSYDVYVRHDLMY